MSRRVDVERLLAELGVAARKRGDEWQAPCPVHSDTDPSWHMSEDGAWYCFGCTQGGGPADLVAAMHGLELRAAFQWLEARGLVGDGPAASAVKVVVTAGLVRRRACTLPPDVRCTPISSWPTPVRRYVENRGITHDQVERWGIGYALQGEVARRIVFPVQDERGVLRSWMARAFDDSDVRYLTPKPGSGADRGALFGQRFWPEVARRRAETLFVAEGAINALACERAGALHVAALGGSNTKYASKRSHVALEQIARVATFGRVVVVSDPDGAGDRVVRALSVLSRHLEVARAVLPKGSDAADLALASLDELRRVLCRAESLQSGRPFGSLNARV